ncbi:MAG: hypothetical protein ACMG6E_06855 [Candidatus Roizmanbacteria bacterium]
MLQYLLLEIHEVDGLVMGSLACLGFLLALLQLLLVLREKGEALLARLVVGEVEQLLHSL